MGLLESIIRSAQGGGGLGDVLEELGRGGQSSTGSTLDEIQRRMGNEQQPQSNNVPVGGDISIEDLERQMGVGRGGNNSGYTQQQYPQQYPQQTQQQQYPQQYPQQQQYPQYPEEYQPQYPQVSQEEQQPQQQTTQQQSGGGLFGGGLMSILKVIGMGALALWAMKKFTK